MLQHVEILHSPPGRSAGLTKPHCLVRVGLTKIESITLSIEKSDKAVLKKPVYFLEKSCFSWKKIIFKHGLQS